MKPDPEKYPLPDGFRWFPDKLDSKQLSRVGKQLSRVGVLSNSVDTRYHVWSVLTPGGTHKEIRTRDGSSSKQLGFAKTQHEALTFMSNWMMLGMHNEVP